MKNPVLFLLIVLLISGCSGNGTDAEVEKKPTKKTIILAIDGGGIKGIIPAISQ